MIAMQHDNVGPVGSYCRGLICRREMLKSAITAAGSCAAAALFMKPHVFATPFSASQESQATNVNTETVHYPSAGFDIQAYLAKPKTEGNHPAIILVHDNWGLNEYAKDTARRFAAAGFVAMAPDLLSRAGGTMKVAAPDAAMAAVNQLPSNSTIEDLKAAYDFLQKYPAVDAAKISSVGYGWGGWRSFMLATAIPSLYRSVMFCGATPITGLENIHAPVMAHYAQYDFRTTGNALPTKKEMTALGKQFTYHLYPGVGHAFFDDTASQYNAAAAQEAWKITIEFLKSSS